MKKFTSVGVAALLLAGSMESEAQSLDKFKADLGKKSVMGKEIRLPYSDVVSYYGFITPDAKPDEVKGGKKYYYLYVWVPAVAPELGIRMVSPVPGSMSPDGSDVVSAAYTANKADNSSYFDTWISLDKAEGITSIGDVAGKGAGAKWNTISQNDDSGEMPAQPSGSKYNSLMRISSEVSNPLKALTVGLYRIGFTTYKTGDVKEVFLHRSVRR